MSAHPISTGPLLMDVFLFDPPLPIDRKPDRPVGLLCESGTARRIGDEQRTALPAQQLQNRLLGQSSVRELETEITAYRGFSISRSRGVMESLWP